VRVPALRLVRAALVLAAFTCGLVAGGCGSSGTATTSAPSADTALEFAHCMRAHGVPNFPDPGAGGGLQITPQSGINPQSPAFQSAQKACVKFAPKFGGPVQMTASERAAALRFAECMRANGESDFPDPTETAASGATRVLVLRGMVFALGPGIDPKSPAFRQAATRCGVIPPGGPLPK
jgi:hypothetical protein